MNGCTHFCGHPAWNVCVSEILSVIIPQQRGNSDLTHAGRGSLNKDNVCSGSSKTQMIYKHIASVRVVLMAEWCFQE